MNNFCIITVHVKLFPSEKLLSDVGIFFQQLLINKQILIPHLFFSVLRQNTFFVFIVQESDNNCSFVVYSTISFFSFFHFYEPTQCSVLFPILSLQHIKSFTFLSLSHPMIFSKNPSALRNYLFLFSFAGQLTSFSSLSLKQQHYIGNKAKGQILKQVFQEKEACQIFQKRTFLTYVCISGGEKCSFFWKISQALFS